MADRPGPAWSGAGTPGPGAASGGRALGAQTGKSPRGRARPAGLRGLTTRGRCLLAGGIAAAICALLLDERDLLRVGIFAAVLPLLAMLAWSVRSVRLSADHLVAPARLVPGSRGTVQLTITNTGSTRTAALEVTEPPTPELTGGLRCLMPPLRASHRAQTEFGLRPLRRGRFVLRAPTIRVGDPFGLWEDIRTLDVRTTVLVVPTLVDLAGMPPSAGSRSAAADRAVAGVSSGDPDVGIREYRNGDDIRTVHWRASARHDELMVRLNEPVSHGGAVIMLDHRAAGHAGEGATSSLETAVTLAASISVHLLAAEHQIRLTTHSGGVLAAGRDIEDDVLAALAVIEPDTRAFNASSIGGTGLVIAILGALDRPSAALLTAARRRGTTGIAFVLDTATWPDTHHARGRSAVGDPAAVAGLQAAGWRVVPIRRGDNLAQAWTQACRGGIGAARPPSRATPIPVVT
ncbi:DUF58 domain-containing protein [Nakamurella sp.]|uniref:DUF58 domain-containing protein n=1 Tax=Nakamurella sp. TaxID=1869182 RepID=UPI003783EEAE